VSRDKTNVERKQFKKFQPLEYAKTFMEKTNYYTKASDSITINSDYLTDSEYEGMKQLIESPIVMMEVDSNTYIPVNIIETNYEFKKYVNDRRMSNIELTIEYTFDNFRQSL
jgi:viroplasmin and RNaseH domain-containing protein